MKIQWRELFAGGIIEDKVQEEKLVQVPFNPKVGESLSPINSEDNPEDFERIGKIREMINSGEITPR